ncbi:MAG TPA: serine--tRNA ligase [Ktedonobacterales bacterium]|jgi:seryl-tRNA synthetase|nr:serine--tRNA ligase [Ktedonobacterales bacterium]HEX5572460.1 serine--tRNA ligase [Ktedonobacterales bacterium]
MLDIAFIREHPDLVKDVARRRKTAVDVDALLAVDSALRATRRRADDLRAEQNRLSKAVRDAGPDKEAREAAIAQGRVVSAELKQLEPDERDLEAKLRDLLLLTPNIPDASVPEGESEEDNVEIKRVGEPRQFDFEPLDHVTLLTNLGMLDLERAAKVGGTRSYILKGEAVFLELALMQFALHHVARKGFLPLDVPALAREYCFIGNSQFPRGREQTYALPDDDVFLVGTAEVSITGMHSGEMLREQDLPMKYVGYSPCYRREAGTYGKDTKGIMRVHQFYKVEQYIICRADHEESVRWHEELLRNAEEIVEALELPYRVLNLCVADLGDAKVKGYDIECWVPSEGRYRETHSDSYFHDYQARRADIRYRGEDGVVRYVHTLNNTALASTRTIIALVENHQQADGRIRIPEALRPWLGGQEYLGKAWR